MLPWLRIPVERRIGLLGNVRSTLGIGGGVGAGLLGGAGGLSQ